MFRATVQIKGVSRLSWSRYHRTPKNENEDDASWEERTWRKRFDTNPDGECVIPPMAMKNTIAAAAKHSGKKIKGGGQQTYTKHFDAGVMVEPKPIPLGIMNDDLEHEWLFVPSNGQAGGGKRVEKCFPVIPEGWTIEVEFVVLDSKITQSIFREMLDYAGRLIGIGRFRPQNRGFYGRFEVTKCTFEQMD